MNSKIPKPRFFTILLQAALSERANILLEFFAEILVSETF